MKALPTLLMIFVFYSVLSQANASGIEANIVEMIKRYDPQAIVSVKKQLRSSGQEKNFGIASLLSAADMQQSTQKTSYDISVWTSLKSRPWEKPLKDLVAPSQMKIIYNDLPDGGPMTSKKQVKAEDKPIGPWKWIDVIYAMLLLFVGIGVWKSGRKQQISSNGGDKAPTADPAPPRAVLQRDELVAAKELGSLITGHGAAHRGFSDWDTEALTELLADLYWSEKDEVAATVAEQLGYTQQQEIMSQWSLGREYLAYLRSCTGIELPKLAAADYIETPILKNINNQDLTIYVREGSVSFDSLSSLRRQNLDLKIEERLELFRSVRSNRVNTAKFKEIKKQSPKRRLPVVEPIIPSNDQEEAQLTSRQEFFTNQEYLFVVSFAIVDKLEVDQVRIHLQAKSAPFLAQALVGPDTQVNRLLGLMPESKRNLIRSYQEKSPSIPGNAKQLELWREFKSMLERPKHKEKASLKKAIAA